MRVAGARARTRTGNGARWASWEVGARTPRCISRIILMIGDDRGGRKGEEGESLKEREWCHCI